MGWDKLGLKCDATLTHHIDESSYVQAGLELADLEARVTYKPCKSIFLNGALSPMGLSFDVGYDFCEKFGVYAGASIGVGGVWPSFGIRVFGLKIGF